MTKQALKNREIQKIKKQFQQELDFYEKEVKGNDLSQDEYIQTFYDYDNLGYRMNTFIKQIEDKYEEGVK